MDFLLDLNWLAVGQIILIDILLGGDNAIVIALACRNLPPNLRTRGIIWGTFGAIGARILLIAFAVTLLTLPYIKMAGGLLLLWIGIKLLASNDDDHGEITASDRLMTAIKTIIVADLVMSVDNVIAIASVAEQSGGDNQMALVIFGIVVSIPIIVWGSTIVLKLMGNFPIIITLGAALLGYLAGGMIFSDSGLTPWLNANLPLREFAVPGINVALNIPGLVGAIVVVAVGTWLAKRAQQSDQ
jgi:YjbE family integral membrane protein